ncbi:MAG: hypothetical protein ACM3OF_10965 [Gemmatimonas sp.]
MTNRPADTGARDVLDRAKALVPAGQRLVWTGELLFVASWSLMWASSLGLVTFVPTAACGRPRRFDAKLSTPIPRREKGRPQYAERPPGLKIDSSAFPTAGR